MKRRGIILTGAAAAAAAQADVAAAKEAQKVALATEVAVTSLLTRIADSAPVDAPEDGMLTGAIYALVKFTFARCWSERRPRLAGELLNRWGPVMMGAVVDAVKQDEPR